MREEEGYCPICSQYRSNLRSINYIDDRIHGITISNDGERITALCYQCRHKIDKELKNGKNNVILSGKKVTLIGYELNKYIESFQKEFKIDRKKIHRV